MQWKPVYKIVSISDIHMGALDPQYSYEQLRVQFVQRLMPLDFNILAICGDYFDARYMSNNPIITYSLMLMDEIVNLCKQKSATLIIIEGTAGHDNGQLSLFYHYQNDPDLDLRIVEKMQFEDAQGLKILCIPEKYGLPEEEYEHFLFESGRYDLCLLHGTFRGSFKGSEIATLKSNHAPVFSLKSFENCAGPILMGHYHIAGCYEGYAYYNGSPLRWCFGQEQEKGFLITLFNPYDRTHYTEMIPIDSYLYTTINISTLVNENPKLIIDHIKREKEINHIDYIRVQFSGSNDNMNIVRNYFKNSSHVTIDEIDRKDKQIEQIDQAVIEQNEKYSYVLDDAMSDYDKFVMYVNQNEGFEYISVDELTKLLEEAL
jgi:hypothetical protein